MRIVRRTAVSAVIAVVALVYSSTTARAAGVLDQVPQDAYVVIKVNNLEGTSKKVAKWAEQLGLNQFVPQFGDPLGSFEKEVGITQGLDRAGELAFVFVNPDTVGGDKEQAMFVLAPTKDYAAFSGNFKAQGLKAGANGVSSFKDKNDQTKDIYIAQWGNFAAISPSQALVGKKPAAAAGALKLSALAARTGNEQDVLIYVNMPAVRNVALPALDKARGEILKEFDRAAGGAGAARPAAPGAAPGAAAGPDAMAKQFAPLMKVIINQYMNAAKAFLTDTDGAFVGLRLNEVGLNATMGADFKQGSYLGDLASKTKNSNADLMAGLPQRKYFAFGGMAVTKETFQKVINDFADPFMKELGNNADAKDIATAVDAAKKSAGSIDSFAFGYTVPTGALGADSVIQTVSVVKGDAQALTTTEDQMLEGMGKFLSSMNAAGGPAGANNAAAGQPKMSFERQPEGKSIGGVKLQTYKFNFEMDENNPQAAQMQQMMQFIYGPNGMGGAYGAVDPKTFIVVQGGTDKLITDTIASAKAGTDPLSKLAPVQAVNKQLPPERFLVQYVDLAQIVTSAVKYAQAFAPNVKMQLPQNLPPIGISAGTSGTSMRFDVHVPTSLVQSLVSAGMQTYMEVQGGGRGGAQPDGL